VSGDLAEALAARAESLCRVPSPIGEERALCDFLEKWARGRFERMHRSTNSLLLWDKARADAPRVALCGHLDTVPVHPDDAGPPRRAGGRLIAPGASDMKGAVAVMMELWERVPAADRFCTLGLVLYAREEGPYQENELGQLLQEVPALGGVDLAICMEPTDNAIQLGCVGSLHASLVFSGRAAHSARPWQGENAIHKTAPLLAELAGRPAREMVSDGLTYREVMSATRIDGGRARNVVPDRCAINVNFRFAPDRSPEAAQEELRALAARHGAGLEVADVAPAAPSFAAHPLVERLRQRTGAAVEPKQAWTDVARLAAAGIPAVNFGPGATAQAHQRGEWVEQSALAASFRMMERFLRT
jgi:succinyl-diaminopimelate desuccinylase